MSARKRYEIEIEPLRRHLAPMVVDAKMKRFWMLADVNDGTLNADRVSAEYSINRQGDYEATVFMGLETAERAAAHAKLNYDVDVEPVEVLIFRKHGGSHER